VKVSEKPLAATFCEVGMDGASGFGTGIDGSARWSLRLLGDFQLAERTGGEKVALPGKRERVLLAHLALSPNGRQPRRKLVTLLWGEAADETTLENLRTSIFNLRKALGDTEHRIIGSEDRDIVLDTSAFQVDVLEFHRLAAAQNTGDLEEAAKLYAGDFLEGLSIESEEFESWRREESTRCKGQVLDALQKLMGQLAASGESERAIETGLRILRLEPLHEGAVRRLMRLYAENGRRSAGVELYKTLAESLKKELGAQPEAETRALYSEITLGGEGQMAAVADVRSPPPTTTVSGAPSVARHIHSAVAVSAPIAHPKLKGRTIGWLTAGLAGAAALAALLFTTFGPATDPARTGGPTTVVAATPTSALALAVLPFANLSIEPDQDFFSDGLTDEITSALAKVPDLKIVARTSAFEFKGQNRNIRTIGEQLGATHLIEGSVRRAGDRVRITVQLIRADDGTRIWSDDFDRQLTDIFTIQEDIARAIASSLSVPLGLRQGERLVANQSDVELYPDYLRARVLFRGSRQLSDAAALLEKVLARDPNYARAWALLASVYQRFPTVNEPTGTLEERRRYVDEWLGKSERAAERAIGLDPNLADGYVPLGLTRGFRGDFLRAEELFSKALALDPLNPEALHSSSNLFGAVGRFQEALVMRQQVMALEPFVAVYNTNVAGLLWAIGRIDNALPALRANSAATARAYLARLSAASGRYSEAIEILTTSSPGTFPAEVLAAAVRLLRSAPSNANSLEGLRPLGGVNAGGLDFVYLHVGAPERFLQSIEENGADGLLQPRQIVEALQPDGESLRKTDRFKSFARRVGLIDYWRAKGWPDLCRPVGADDFVCE
jgi:TolB-like protein/DNA-binding SARP family transcriptional activator/Tfp pilus assembly protein PilF